MRMVARSNVTGKASERATRAQLAALMEEDGIAPECIQMLTVVRGHFPAPGRLPKELPEEYIARLIDPKRWGNVVSQIRKLTKGGVFSPDTYQAKRKNRILVSLTADNSRKLRELADLVSASPSRLINMMVSDELDSFLNAGSGMLETTIDGWKYRTVTEAKRVAKAVNAWNAAAGFNVRLSCKGSELVNRKYRQELADTRRWCKRHSVRKVA